MKVPTIILCWSPEEGYLECLSLKIIHAFADCASALNKSFRWRGPLANKIQNLLFHFFAKTPPYLEGGCAGSR